MTSSQVVKSPTMDGVAKMIEKPKEEPERETWDKKIDFLLSVIGFAVDLGNVWRFPYICYRNGGGAFLLPYMIMLIFGGLPLFYMELALGQFQRCGCLTVWKRICPMFKGLGIAICVVATYVSWYYNTIIAWSFYYFFSSMRSEVPWKHCNHSWNTPNCTSFSDRIELIRIAANNTDNTSRTINFNQYKLANEEFFENAVLGLDKANGLENVGPVKWEIAMCLLLVFTIVYFAMWKGVKSSGKAVWITATMPYVVLLILLVRGCTLEGASKGIYYYLNPQFEKMAEMDVWVDAAAQILFSLGPGFGVLLALASYNKPDNNCYRDAILTSAINCGTSILAGFVVFSVLGHMAYKQGVDVKDVARDDVGLIFIVYPEAISNLYLSPLWAVIFFFMLITLGLDTTFGGLEAIATGLLDEFPSLRKRRELFTFGLMIYCFWGALATTTHGGIYVVQLMDTYGAPISLIFVVFLEAAAISWIYGVERFSHDIQSMLGFYPGLFWRICWKYISPLFLLTLFIMSIIKPNKPEYGGYQYPDWAIAIGWCMVFSSLLCIPAYIIYKFITTPGGIKERLRSMITPEETPNYGQEVVPIFI